MAWAPFLFLPLQVTRGQGPAALYSPTPPSFLALKALGLESVLPLDLGLKLPEGGFCRPENQLQRKERERRARWEAGRRSKER